MNLYTIDRPTLASIMAKKHLDAANLSRLSGVHVNTIGRLSGELNPKGMKPERLDKASVPIILKVAQALRVRAQTFADLPERPEEIPTPTKPQLTDHRGHSSARERRRKLSELEEELLEVAG